LTEIRMMQRNVRPRLLLQFRRVRVRKVESDRVARLPIDPLTKRKWIGQE
jgi:hypothetical protein